MENGCSFGYEALVPCSLVKGHDGKHMREIVCRYCWKVFTAPIYSRSVGCSTYCKGRLSAYNRQIEKSRWDLTGKQPSLPGMGKQLDLTIENATI
jgi:hypothetical protein